MGIVGISKHEKTDLNSILEPDNKQEKSDLDVLKELFVIKDIETKTELSIQQVIKFNQKRTIARLLNWKSLDSCLNDFMVLMVSKNRAGRGEFISGFKSEREQSIQKSHGGFFNNMKNRLGWQ